MLQVTSLFYKGLILKSCNTFYFIGYMIVFLSIFLKIIWMQDEAVTPLKD